MTHFHGHIEHMPEYADGQARFKRTLKDDLYIKCHWATLKRRGAMKLGECYRNQVSKRIIDKSS